MREIKTGKPLSEQENDSLQTYLSEIGKENLLSEQEEQELSAKIQNGDESAIEKLTTANLRFVVSIAKRYQDRGLGINDLISEGNFGLIKAARKFDAAKGQRFVQYAVHFIRQAIENAIQEQSGIYTLPHSMDDPDHVLHVFFYIAADKAVVEHSLKNSHALFVILACGSGRY